MLCEKNKERERGQCCEKDKGSERTRNGEQQLCLRYERTRTATRAHAGALTGATAQRGQRQSNDVQGTTTSAAVRARASPRPSQARRRRPAATADGTLAWLAHRRRAGAAPTTASLTSLRLSPARLAWCRQVQAVCGWRVAIDGRRYRACSGRGTGCRAHRRHWPQWHRSTVPPRSVAARQHQQAQRPPRGMVKGPKPPARAVSLTQACTHAARPGEK